MKEFQLKTNAATLVSGKIETSSPDTACLLGIKKAENPFTPVQELKLVTDFK